MKKLIVLGLGVGLGAAAVLASRARSTADPRPLAITVDRPLAAMQQQLADGGLPAPLAELGPGTEIDLTAAPGERGTEIRLSLSDKRINRKDARQALRTTRQLIETGEVMPPDIPVTRRRTLTSLPLELAIRRSGREGRL